MSHATLILLEAKVGHGKTYRAVKKYLVPHLGIGGVCAHNLKLKRPQLDQLLKRRYDWEFQEGQLIELVGDKLKGFQKHTPEGSPDLPVMVIWDEAQGDLNARSFNEEFSGEKGWKKEFFSWLCTARHDHMVVIFITQHAGNIDAQVKRLVVTTEHSTDMWQYKLPFVRIPSPVNGFMIKEYNGVHEDGECCGLSLEWKDPAIFEVYDSWNKVRDWGRAHLQNRFDKGRVVMKKEWKRFVYGMGVLMLLCSWQVFELWKGQRRINAGVAALGVQLDAISRAAASSGSTGAVPLAPAVAGVTAPPGSAAAAPAAVVAGAPGEPAIQYVPAIFSGSVERGGVLTVYANGREYRRGDRVGDNVILTATEDRVLMRRRDGTFVLLYPADSDSSSLAQVPGAVHRAPAVAPVHAVARRQ